jgi:hypothetical protein
MGIKNTILIIIALIFLINLVDATNLYYKINFTYDNNDLEINNIKVIYSTSYNYLTEGEINLRIKDGEKILSEYNFNVPNQIFNDNFDDNFTRISGEIIEIKKGSFEITVPYDENADNINAYFNDKEIASHNIKELSKKDVKNKETMKNQETIEKRPQSTNNILLFFSIAIVIIIIISFIIFIISRNLKKKAQISVFIIISILLVFIFAFIFYLNNKQVDKNNIEIIEIKNFIDMCIKQTGEEAIYHISESGGDYDAPELSTDNQIAYYYINNKNYNPTKESIENELSKYMNNLLFFCLNSFENYPDLKIKQSEVKTKTEIQNDKVNFDLDYLISIKQGETTYTLENFKTTINVKLGRIISSINEIINEQTKNKDYICISCMEKIAEKDDLYIEINDYIDDTIIVSVIDKSSKILGDELYFYYANKF